MRSGTLASLVASAILAAVLLAQGCHSYSFSAWETAFNVSYASNSERLYRKSIFDTHSATIAQHNARPDVSYKMGFNKFSDRTFDEWRVLVEDKTAVSHLQRLHDDITGSSNQPAAATAPTSLPSSVNWTAAGVFGPVHDVGKCLCAWAVTVADTITALEAITSGSPPVPLSIQQLVDCTLKWGLTGCAGGWPQVAYTYVTSEGLCNATEYPFHASNGPCVTNCTPQVAPETISYAPLMPNEAAFMQQLVKQPVLTAIGLTADIQHYESGVFTAPCDLMFYHCVTVAGYGTSAQGEPYWLIRNDWGTGWGEAGYMKMGRGMKYKNPVHGECDVLGLGLYPVLA